MDALQGSSGAGGTSTVGQVADGEVSTVATVRAWMRALAAGLKVADDAERVDVLRALEELKCAAEAAQAQVAVELDSSVRERAARAGVPADRRGRGVANQVGLARRCSPHRARRLLGLAKVVHAELPCTAAAWRAGLITEWRAMLIARHTATVSVEVRREIDAEVAGDPVRLEGWSDRETVAEVMRLAVRLDQDSVVASRERAASERRVSVRPAPESMAWLSALLPVKDGVAVSAALSAAADSARAAGDDRTRGQVMADTLVERVTARPVASQQVSGEPSYSSQASDSTQTSDSTQASDEAGRMAGDEPAGADTGDTTSVAAGHTGAAASGAGPMWAEASAPVHRPPRGPAADIVINLVMTDHALLGASEEPARIPGYGLIPAALAREMIVNTLVDSVAGAGTVGDTDTNAGPGSGQDGETAAARVWVRRLFTDPAGHLVAMESTSRLFPKRLAEFIKLRDQTCRTPWCDARIRHIDHITPAAQGGATSAVGGQGLCEACNYAKSAPGWQARPTPGPGAPWAAETITPTGHRYTTEPDPWPTPDIHPRERLRRLSLRPPDHDLAA